MKRLLILLPAAALLLTGCNRMVEHAPLSSRQSRSNVTARNNPVGTGANRFWSLPSHGMLPGADTSLTGAGFDNYVKFEVAERAAYDLGLDTHLIAEGRQQTDDNFALPNRARPYKDPVPNDRTDRTPVRGDIAPTMPGDPVVGPDAIPYPMPEAVENVWT